MHVCVYKSPIDSGLLHGCGTRQYMEVLYYLVVIRTLSSHLDCVCLAAARE
jgi:hypothetical protein